MTRTKGPLRWAGVFVTISSVLHVVAVAMGGLVDAPQMMSAAVAYAAFSIGLMRGMRWVGYVAFVVVFIGLSVAIGGLWSTGPIPGWVFGAIVAANAATLLCLFVALWRPQERSVQQSRT